MAGTPTTSFSMLRSAWGLFWREADASIKKRMLWSLGFLAAASILTALAPLALKRVVDNLDQAAAPATSATTLIALYVLCLGAGRALGELRSLIYALAERRLFKKLNERFFAHLMKLTLKFHMDRRTGAINQTLGNGIQGFQKMTYQLVSTLLPVLLELTTILVVFLYFGHPEFLVLFVLAIAFYTVIFAKAGAHVARHAQRAAAAEVDAMSTMTDSIINFETIKYFTAEATVIERARNVLATAQAEWGGFHKAYTGGMLLVALVFSGLTFAAIGMGVYQVRAGTLTIGGFVLVNTYMIQLVRPVEMLGYATQGIMQGVAMLEKMLLLLDEPCEADPVADDRYRPVAGKVTFENLSFSYAQDRRVLDRVSFSVPAGRMLGIVGVSGSGKSTLVRLLMRLLEPEQGRILLDDAPIARMPLATLRGAISVIPQDLALFNDSIEYNIGIGRAGASRDEIMCAARVARLHDFVGTLPEGYDTRIGERGVRLSGGERQRVAIARAVLKHPLVYVFDEATSSLDSLTEREILRNLRDVSRDTTTLVIAHRLSAVVDADEIVLLDKGAVMERGSHADLLAQGGRYAALWYAQLPAAELPHLHAMPPTPAQG